MYYLRVSDKTLEEATARLKKIFQILKILKPKLIPMNSFIYNQRTYSFATNEAFHK